MSDFKKWWSKQNGITLRMAAPEVIAKAAWGNQQVRIDELKANHADMVKRNAALRDRPDIPTERVKSVQVLVDRIDKLEKALLEAADDIVAYSNHYNNDSTIVVTEAHEEADKYRALAELDN